MSWRTRARSVKPKPSRAYCRITLRDADDIRESVVVEIDGRPVCLYVAEEIEIVDERKRRWIRFKIVHENDEIESYVNRCGDVLEERLVVNSEE